MTSTLTTRLFLVRHGQTALSRNDDFCGVTDAPLTEFGHEQARNAAEYLRHETIDALYSSPQIRAMATAQPIAEALKLEIQPRPVLREMDFGKWEGQSRRDLERDYPEELAKWESGSWMVHPPEGETQQDVLARVIPLLVELLASHAGQQILLVAHKTTLRLLISHVLNMSLPDSRSLHLDPAGLTRLNVTGDQVQMTTFNNTSYLPKEQ